MELVITIHNIVIPLGIKLLLLLIGVAERGDWWGRLMTPMIHNGSLFILSFKLEAESWMASIATAWAREHRLPLHCSQGAANITGSALLKNWGLLPQLAHTFPA